MNENLHADSAACIARHVCPPVSSAHSSLAVEVFPFELALEFELAEKRFRVRLRTYDQDELVRCLNCMDQIRLDSGETVTSFNDEMSRDESISISWVENADDYEWDLKLELRVTPPDCGGYLDNPQRLVAVAVIRDGIARDLVEFLKTHKNVWSGIPGTRRLESTTQMQTSPADLALARSDTIDVKAMIARLREKAPKRGEQV